VKRILAVTVLLFLCPFALSAFADVPLPSGVSNDEGRVDINPAFQLPVNRKPPLDCSPKTRGTIALDSQVQLCICDGADWKLANTIRPCAWTPAK